LIKIDKKQYMAEQVIEVARSNTIPMQRVEEGFSVQDHIGASPLVLKVVLILFDIDTRNPLHSQSNPGSWVMKKGGDVVWEERYDKYRGDTYEHLKDIYESKRLVQVNCSGHAKDMRNKVAMHNTLMIYEDMAIASLGQAVQRGDTYLCDVTFIQITKTSIASRQLYVQEVAEVLKDGELVSEATIRWSEEPFPPSNTETTTPVDETEDQPIYLRSEYRQPPFEAMPSSTHPGLLNNLMLWCADRLNLR